MTGIYWREGEAVVKDYSALTKAGATTVTIKLVVKDHYALSHILSTLDEGIAASKAPLSKSRPGRPLMLTDQRDRHGD